MRLILLWSAWWSREGLLAKYYCPSRQAVKVVAKHFAPYFLAKGINLRQLPADVRSEVEEVREVALLNRCEMKTEMWLKVKVGNPKAIPKLREEVRKQGFLTAEDRIRTHLSWLASSGEVPWYDGPCSSDDCWESLSAPVEVPPFIALDIEVAASGSVPDPSRADQPVVAVSLSTGRQTAVGLNCRAVDCDRAPDRAELPGGAEAEVYKFGSEEDLIRATLATAASRPMLVTFNGDAFDLPYLARRAERLGLQHPLEPVAGYREPVSGRDVLWWEPRHGMHFDLYPFFRNSAIKAYTFGNAYDQAGLDAISEALLGVGKLGEAEEALADPSLLPAYSAQDAWLTAQLFAYKGFLPMKLAAIIARVSKMPPGEVIRKTVKSWIEQMLLRRHRARGWLYPGQAVLSKYPRKMRVASSSATGSRKYRGAEVIDPPRGRILQNVWVFDFASLYPTIIARKNVSYETVEPYFECEAGEEAPEVRHPVCQSVRGALSEAVGALRDLRVRYKHLAKDPSVPKEEREYYDAVQATLKVFINASYGVFGTESFDLYTPAAAETVTAYARWALRKAREIARSMGFEIVYGDTDSLFVLNCSRERADEFVRRVGKELGFDIEVDKVFKWVAFHAKKNYLGVTEDGKLVIKGMMGIKSNVPPAIKRMFQRVVEEAVRGMEEGGPEEARRRASEAARRALRSLREADPEELALSATVTKAPEEYRSRPPHIQALELARRLGWRGEAEVGMKVRYVKGLRGWLPLVKGFRVTRSMIDWKHYRQLAQSVLGQVLSALGAGGASGGGLERFLTGRRASRSHL